MNLTPQLYEHERRLLSYILTEGRRTIPAHLPTTAYFESDQTGEAHRRFAEEVNDSWAHVTPAGELALDGLNAHVTRLEAQYEQLGMHQIRAGTKAAANTLQCLRHNPAVVFEGEPSDSLLVLAIS